ncbi:MAG: MFS transporter, partial [Gemmatimonadota bacterium]
MNQMSRNYYALLWHATFLALTLTFTDVNTILPALLVNAGGTDIHIGLLTAIMVGTPIAGQVLFASYLHLKARKKAFLLLGINLRIVALILVAVVLATAELIPGRAVIVLVLVLMFAFALGGTFA